MTTTLLEQEFWEQPMTSSTEVEAGSIITELQQCEDVNSVNYCIITTATSLPRVWKSQNNQLEVKFESSINLMTACEGSHGHRSRNCLINFL